MKRFHPTVATLLVAHAIGSYCGYAPTLVNVLRFHAPHPPGLWLYLPLAPLLTPIYLALMTVAEFPHYYDTLPAVWACYAIPFVLVCLLRRRRSPALRFALFPVVLTLLVIAFWLPRGIAESTPWKSPLVGRLAPDFTLTTLTGDARALSQEKGHVVLIDFWATSCPPCLVELKQSIAALAADAGLRDRGLRVWAVDVMDEPDVARAFMRDHHYEFDVLPDPGPIATKPYPLLGIPTTYLVARDGTVLKAFVGFGQGSAKQLRDDVEAALH